MAAKKYAEVARGLPRAEPRDLKYQARVDEAKALVADREPGSLVQAYKRRRALRDAVEDALSEINVGIAALEQLAWSAMEAQKLESLRVDGGGYFSPTPDVSVAVEDRDLLVAWFKANGLERALGPAHATVESITKERLLAGLALPDGVRVGAYTKTTWRKD
jgi:hypothetical protein